MFSRQKFELSVQGPLISNFQDVVLEGALQGLGTSMPTMSMALSKHSQMDD
jgi:hypothetical protein